ncbi:helix-turn-helix domain-containing protein [[Clostridium] innocuum]|nr:helix-turn-helix domain-containing protein [[Clostridium] innocuum]
MLLDICKTHRKRYGCLIRQKRLQSGYTQKELIEELHHAVSLRSYIAMENGKILQDMELYDQIFALLDLHYNYTCDPDPLLNPVLEKLFLAWNAYDDTACISCLKELLRLLAPYRQFSWEAILYNSILILLEAVKEDRLLTQSEYAWFMQFRSIYPLKLQSMLATILYQYQYQLPHDQKQLRELLHHFPMLAHPDGVRNCITYALHQTNLEHNDLPAWQQLQKYRKQEENSGNWTALFDLYHWLCLISARIHVPAFEGLHMTCERLLQNHVIQKERKLTYYFNLSGVYHTVKDYAKEEHYLQLFLAERKKQLLPFLFWYIHNQRLQKKRIDSLLSRTYDVQDCSERLQILWGFYERLPHTDAKAAQSYIMKECLPLLSELALEFQLVFLHELQLLITRTRNYKDLHIYMEQLHL